MVAVGIHRELDIAIARLQRIHEGLFRFERHDRIDCPMKRPDGLVFQIANIRWNVETGRVADKSHHRHERGEPLWVTQPVLPYAVSADAHARQVDARRVHGVCGSRLIEQGKNGLFYFVLKPILVARFAGQLRREHNERKVRRKPQNLRQGFEQERVGVRTTRP